MNAARDMQVAISKGEAVSVDGAPLAIRVGCDYGPVIPDERDVFGSTVNTANRVTSQAKAAQVLITSNMVDRLGPEWRAAVRQIDLTPIRGKMGETAMFEALWQSEDITSMLPTISWNERRAKSKARMRLRYQGKELLVDAEHPHINLGRSDENDLVVKGNLISRLHARVEINRDRFLLVDQSTNGSFVVTRQGDEQFVRRDSIPLHGEGVIGLGRIVQPGSAQLEDLAPHRLLQRQFPGAQVVATAKAHRGGAPAGAEPEPVEHPGQFVEVEVELEHPVAETVPPRLVAGMPN
jgi:hypothetical protein